MTLEKGALQITVNDPALGDTVTLNPQLLVLSSAIVPRENEELASLMKLQRTQEGFFLEAHMKLRPVDLATEGMYLCGLAHSPKPLRRKPFPGRCCGVTGMYSLITRYGECWRDGGKGGG